MLDPRSFLFITLDSCRYDTFEAAADDGRVTDTFINYAQGLIDYIEQDLGGGTLTVPALDDFSTQSFVPAS